MENFSIRSISIQALKRLPYYLEYLKKIHSEGAEIVSAPLIAKNFKLSEIQVRKDFAAVSPEKGKPKLGFNVSELIYNMEEILGYRNVNEAVLAGAGSLGRALLSYGGFAGYGVNIIAAFDIDENIIGASINGKKVFSVDKLSSFCKRLGVQIGIITAPASAAQSVCNALIEGGAAAIWNFAPTRLEVPDGVAVQNENMGASLALLSNFLKSGEKDLRGNL